MLIYIFYFLLQEHPDFDAKRCFPFVCDLAAESWDVPFKEDSLDYIILIFVLSAIHPEKYDHIFCSLCYNNK